MNNKDTKVSENGRSRNFYSFWTHVKDSSNSLKFVCRFQLLWLEFLVPATLFSCVMLLSGFSNLNIWERATEFLKYGIAAFWVVFAVFV